MKAARFKAYTEIFIVIIIWSIASIVIKLTLSAIEPVPFLTYRFFISSILALFSIKGVLKIIYNKKLFFLTLVYTLVSTVFALGILFVGLEKTSVVNLAIVSAIEPLILTYLGHKFFHDHLSKRAKIGVFIAVIGAIMALVIPVISAYNVGTFEGNMYLILFIVADLVGILMLKKLLKKNVSALGLTNFSFIVSFISFLIISLVTSNLGNLISIVYNLPLKFHLGVWYMALLSGTVAYTMRARAQKTLTVTDTSIMGYLGPIFSTALAIVFLSEEINLSFLLGTAFISLGVFLVEFKKKKV